ncbi:Gldg family protein [uncultured Polaribacter sp.]|uniref:Gldg family protein n=1 Tax=uncultured Polaribacter sp. TaxID=174711 RepID=UPI002638E00F|nr:Gldg family protein [uncultured Polaribacter sp.]
MKKILKIAKVELSILFYSPIAWLVLIIFTIQCGVSITDLIDAKEANQQLGYDLKSLTTSIFGGNQGFFTSVKSKLYLYIPLLTMGLMSRELSSGSIKLLYSSPITNFQIILGKFCAMAIYCMLFVLILFGAFFTGLITIESLDIEFILGGILGLYLLACAYSAIGLFMSSLTSYQVVAAITTLAVFGVLNFMGSVGQSIDFVRNITYWLVLSDRVDNFINGLISSKDVIYFILIIALFLTLTIMKLNKGRETRSLGKIIMKYSLLIMGALAIGYLSSLPSFTGYYDTTRFKTNTLTQNTQDLLKQLDKPVNITVYANVVNSFGQLGSPKFRIYDQKQFDTYIRFLPNMNIEYIPYYDYTLDARDDRGQTLLERAQKYATAFGYDFVDVLAPEEIKKIIDLTSESNGFVRVIEHDGKTANVRMFYDLVQYPGEAEISAAIKNILTTSPKIGILQGNGERNIEKRGDKDYKSLLNELNSRASLINQGFTTVKILNNENKILIPENLSALIIADPIEAYSNSELEGIIKYLQSGGNAIIAEEPNKQDLLNPILKTIGVTFSEGTLLQESDDYSLDLLKTHFTKQAYLHGFSFKEDQIVSMPSTMAIAHKDTLEFKTTPILVTDKNQVWNYKKPFNIETDSIGYNPSTDKKVEATVALALTRTLNNKHQKIMVLGDADFMSNGEFGRKNLKIRTKNFEFATAIFKWFSNGEYPIDTTRPKPIDNKIIASQDQLSWIKIGYAFALPFLLGVFGLIILLKRRRH